jgi:hypothetical protein
MRNLRNFLVVFGFGASLPMLLCPAESSPSLHDLHCGDPAQKLLRQVEDCGRVGDYRAMYALLHSDYTRNIKEETFAQQLSKVHFRLIRLDATNIHWFESSGYMIVIYGWEEDGGKKEATEVVFFAKESGALKLLNFPFAYGVVPNFFEAPCLISHDAAK